jgi:hypothetical protein
MSNIRPRKHSEKNYRARIVFNVRVEKKGVTSDGDRGRQFHNMAKIGAYLQRYILVSSTLST